MWLATLITLAWQYENWHGRRDYEEQIALFKAEYGDMKWHDFTPPRVADEENFFAAPVFETFVVKEPRRPPARGAGQSEEVYNYQRKCDELADALPHGRFLRMKTPEIKTVPCGWVGELPPEEGIAFLDLKTWVQEEAKAGKQKPGGMTDIQWLQASLPEDETVQGFIAALTRKKASLLPHAADRWAVGEKLNNPMAIPLNSWSGVFEPARRIALRARAAARAGDGLAARQHCEVLWLLAEGFGNAHTMVGSLVALALTGVVNTATTEALACRCWTEADFVILRDRMQRIDEERWVFTALNLEGFGRHLWPGDNKDWIRRGSRKFTSSWKPDHMMVWIMARGPDGWIDANLAWQLRWWQKLMVPDSRGDDLLALKRNLEANLQPVMQESVRGLFGEVPSPRKVLAALVLPEMSNIPSNALQQQTRRRELLLAIATERHLLAKGTLPKTVEDLVPAFIESIPGDPYQPGAPLRWEAGTDGIRYRILSANNDARPGFPEQVP